jgi:hypothetical protein
MTTTLEGCKTQPKAAAIASAQMFCSWTKDLSIIEEDNKIINLPALLNQEFAITP